MGARVLARDLPDAAVPLADPCLRLRQLQVQHVRHHALRWRERRRWWRRRRWGWRRRRGWRRWRRWWRRRWWWRRRGWWRRRWWRRWRWRRWRRRRWWRHRRRVERLRVGRRGRRRLADAASGRDERAVDGAARGERLGDVQIGPGLPRVGRRFVGQRRRTGCRCKVEDVVRLPERGVLRERRPGAEQPEPPTGD